MFMKKKGGISVASYVGNGDSHDREDHLLLPHHSQKAWGVEGLIDYFRLGNEREELHLHRVTHVGLGGEAVL